jgi:hypothetical protein
MMIYPDENLAMIDNFQTLTNYSQNILSIGDSSYGKWYIILITLITQLC